MAQRPMVACRKARRFSSRNLALRPGNFHVGGSAVPRATCVCCSGSRSAQDREEEEEEEEEEFT